MLVLKLTETDDGRIMVESPHRVIATFQASKQEVISYLEEKAEECGEELRLVEEFTAEDMREHVSIRRLMKSRFD